jgi:methylmalonyl-CoA/ethylmalonyl-CoA epimerase
VLICGPMIRDVHHVGIAIRDMEAANAFYGDALGLLVVKEGDVPARGVKAALLAVGGSFLELVQPTDEDSPFAKYIGERSEGLHHIGLLSDDVDAQVTRLNEMAVLLEDHEPREGFTGRLSYLSPLAFDGALLEVVQPEKSVTPGPSSFGGRASPVRGRGENTAAVTRIDHVVMHVPSVDAVCKRFEEYFGVPTKRRFERGPRSFAFLRPGDVIIELIGPNDGGDPESGRIAGLAFEVKGIDDLAASLKEKGYPIGEPHAALQGGRIVSVHHSGACGVPVAFIDFS